MNTYYLYKKKKCIAITTNRYNAEFILINLKDSGVMFEQLSAVKQPSGEQLSAVLAFRLGQANPTRYNSIHEALSAELALK